MHKDCCGCHVNEMLDPMHQAVAVLQVPCGRICCVTHYLGRLRCTIARWDLDSICAGELCPMCFRVHHNNMPDRHEWE